LTDEQMELKAQGRCIDCGRQVDTRRTFRCTHCDVRHGSVEPPKSAKTIKQRIDGFNAGLPGYDHPFAGIPPQLDDAVLYGRREYWWNGWDGMHAGRLKVHPKGHHTAHTGACAIEPAEEPHERLIRQHNLDHQEASLVRDIAAHINDTLPMRARRMGVPERTLRRVRDRLRTMGLRVAG